MENRPRSNQNYSQEEQEIIVQYEENERKNNSLTNRVGRKLGVAAAARAFHKRSHANTMLMFELPDDYIENKLLGEDQER